MSVVLYDSEKGTQEIVAEIKPTPFEESEEITKEISVMDVCQILGTVIKRDLPTTAITFLSVLLTYTDRNQMVLAYKADSSTGKSYIPLEIVALFPKEDIIKLAGASPTAFIHETGTPVYEEYTDKKGGIRKRLAYILVDLERKILLFKDQPDYRLMEKLRSFASKDEKESIFKIADRTTSGQNRTKTVVMRGFSTILYCSARLTADDQENTRTFILSPETSQEKLRETIELIAQREEDFDKFQTKIMMDKDRWCLAQRIKTIGDKRIREITIKREDMKYLQDEFLKRHPYLLPRHQRDFPRLIALAKAHALLNFKQRETEKEDVLQVEREDINVALSLYDSIAKSNELGIPPALLDWYTKVLVPIWDAGDKADRRTISRKHLQVYHQPLNRTRFEKDMIPSLEAASLAMAEQDADDKRKTVYVRVTEA